MDDPTPSGFIPYKPFLYTDKDVAVAVRPEDVKGCQTYQDFNDDKSVWTVLITMRDNTMRVKLPQSSARNLVEQLTIAMAAETRRAVHNSLLLRKRD